MCCILQVIWVFPVSFKQVTKSSCLWTTIHWRVTAETTTSSPNCAIAVTGLKKTTVICHHNFLVKRYVTLCANRAIRGGVIAIWAFDLMTLNIALCHAVTLIFDLLTLKVHGTLIVAWSYYVRNLSEIEQSPAELLITFANFCTRFVTLWLLL